MPLFDTYIVVDWSASSSPRVGANSVWIACRESSRAEPQLVNPSTRASAFDRLHVILHRQMEHQRRVLIGYDFAYGYPAGLAKVLGGEPAPLPRQKVWQFLAEHIHDRSDNSNDRFQVASAINTHVGNGRGPFWGRPRQQTGIPARRPTFPFHTTEVMLSEYRHTEKYVISWSGRRPQSVWKLFGHGSVGSQSLVGIPVVARLRYDSEFAPASIIWPFETGFEIFQRAKQRPLIVHAEIWPGILPETAQGYISRDEGQVLNLSAYLQSRDAKDTLIDWFEVGEELEPEARSACEQEEGWILGAYAADWANRSIPPD